MLKTLSCYCILLCGLSGLEIFCKPWLLFAVNFGLLASFHNSEILGKAEIGINCKNIGINHRKFIVKPKIEKENKQELICQDLILSCLGCHHLLYTLAM